VVVIADIVSKNASVNESSVVDDHERQRRDRAHDGPRQRHQQEAVAHLELAVVRARGDHQRHADREREQHRDEEVRGDAVAEGDRSGDRHDIGEAEHQHQPAEDVRDRKHQT
jgi:hypothetical protein